MKANKKSKLFLVIAILILITGLYFFNKFANSPASGKVKETTPISQSTTEVPLAETGFDSPYASFSYPKVLLQKRSDPATGQVLTDYIFNYQSLYPWHLVVTIYNLPGGNLNQNSDYSFRKLNPSNYQESVTTINGNNVHIMNDLNSQGFNQVAFIASGSYQAAIALSSDNPDSSSLKKALNIILGSWQWH